MVTAKPKALDRAGMGATQPRALKPVGAGMQNIHNDSDSHNKTDGLQAAKLLYKPHEKAEKVRTFEGTGRREATPSRPHRHGKIKWWKGEIHVEGVTLSVVASPSGIALPAGVELDDDLRERVKRYLTSEAAKLNSRYERGGVRHA